MLHEYDESTTNQSESEFIIRNRTLSTSTYDINKKNEKGEKQTVTTFKGPWSWSNSLAQFL